MENKEIKSLNKEINKCRRCILWKTAKNAVPGEGFISSKIMFIGEAPGKEEDLTGRPFVGRAGKLLDELLFGSGIKREEVFITSVLKHRPPKNRQPRREELSACEIWWKKQIEIIKPELIVLLGKFALDTVLNENKSLTKNRGKLVVSEKEWGRQRFFITYHPSLALRFPKFKEILKKDFKKLTLTFKSL